MLINERQPVFSAMPRIKMNQKGSFIKHELSTLARGEAGLRGE